MSTSQPTQDYGKVCISWEGASSKWSTHTKCVLLTTNVEVIVMAHQSDSLWLLRLEVSSIPPEMLLEPGRKGWVSCTGARSEKRLTTIEKLPPVDAPIIENITISEFLTKLQNWTAAVRLRWILVGVDCGEAIIAYKMNSTLLNGTKGFSSNLYIPHICAYFGATFKYIYGRGVEKQFIIQSDQYAIKSNTYILQRKHYNRFLYVQRVLSSGPSAAFIVKFELKKKSKIPVIAVLQTVTIEQTYDNLIALMADEEVLYLIGKFEEEIRHGKLGMIAQYSMGYHLFAFFFNGGRQNQSSYGS